MQDNYFSYFIFPNNPSSIVRIPFSILVSFSTLYYRENLVVVVCSDISNLSISSRRIYVLLVVCKSYVSSIYSLLYWSIRTVAHDDHQSEFILSCSEKRLACLLVNIFSLF